MKEYCKKYNLIFSDLCLLSKFSANHKDIFTNKKLLEAISECETDDYKVLYIFKKNFEQLKYFMDEFIKSILDNSSLIPYIIKCICKIIYVLISKKVNLFFNN